MKFPVSYSTCTQKHEDRELLALMLTQYLASGGTIKQAVNQNSSPVAETYRKAQLQRDIDNAAIAKKNQDRIAAELRAGETSVSAISVTLKLTPNCILRHVANLRDAGKVTHRKEGVRSHWLWVHSTDS